MSAPHIERFLEESSVIPGSPSFNSFISSVAIKGFLGQDNASRVRHYGQQLITEETDELLAKIEDLSGPEQHPLSKHIYPLVRTADDFSVGDMVYVQVAEKNAAISINTVWAIEQSSDLDDSESEFAASEANDESRGVVVIDKPGFGIYKILPQWPALIPERLVDAIDSRKDMNSSDRRAVAGFANSYFQSCFFDRFYETHKFFEESAHRTPKNLGLMTYIKSKN